MTLACSGIPAPDCRRCESGRFVSRGNCENQVVDLQLPGGSRSRALLRARTPFSPATHPSSASGKRRERVPSENRSTAVP